MTDDRMISRLRRLLVARAERVGAGDLSERAPLELTVRGESVTARVYRRYNGTAVLALEVYVDEIDLHPRLTRWVATRSGVMPFCTLQIDRRRNDGSARLLVTHTVPLDHVTAALLDEVLDSMTHQARTARERITGLLAEIEEELRQAAQRAAEEAERARRDTIAGAAAEDDHDHDDDDDDDAPVVVIGDLWIPDDVDVDPGHGDDDAAVTPAAVVDERPALEQLQSLVGLEPVKHLIGGLARLHEFDRRRARRGQPAVAPSPHLVFTGNPGTGKTTVARLVGQLYREIGLLPSGHVVEASRADLVAAYLGQTAIKTRRICEQALGGVLFIDEAYTLTQGHFNEYGDEAIGELLTFMENHRGEFAVIVAGYPEEMHGFLESNPGLRNRFDEIIAFPDYSAQELMVIFQQLVRDKRFRLTEAAVVAVERVIAAMPRGRGFANGRAVRQLFTQITMRHVRGLAERGVDSRSMSTIDAWAVLVGASVQSEHPGYL